MQEITRMNATASFKGRPCPESLSLHPKWKAKAQVKTNREILKDERGIGAGPEADQR
jgi:hypothetical protein